MTHHVTVGPSKCQAWTTRGFPCNGNADGTRSVLGISLCRRHSEVLERRGGLQVRRSSADPVEAIVRMDDGYRLYPAEMGTAEVRSCRVCGCTDLDCSGCVERTGEPCYWVEPDLCSACQGVGAADPEAIYAQG